MVTDVDKFGQILRNARMWQFRMTLCQHYWRSHVWERRDGGCAFRLFSKAAYPRQKVASSRDLGMTLARKGWKHFAISKGTGIGVDDRQLLPH